MEVGREASLQVPVEHPICSSERFMIILMRGPRTYNERFTNKCTIEMQYKEVLGST